MKSKFTALLVAAGLLSLAANAVVMKEDRPIRTANHLSEVDAPKFDFPKPIELTLRQNDKASRPTSFVMTVDTGLRCIMAPCPSSKEIEFHIRNIRKTSQDITRYTAFEVMDDKFFGNVELFPRRLVVYEEELSNGNFEWRVKVNQSGKARHFKTVATPDYTIQSVE